MKFTQIVDFKLGTSIRGFFICKEKHLKFTKNGDLYLDVVLIDSTGIIHCKMWDLVSDFQSRFNIGSTVAVKGKVGEYNEMLQLIINQIDTASVAKYRKYGFNEKDLFRSVDESIISLWKRVDKNSKSLKKPLRDLVQSILSEYKNKIQLLPYSCNDQFPLKGAFLKSIAVNSDICLEIVNNYPLLNKELSLSGTILFNIGMVIALNDDIMPVLTDEGAMIGSQILGRDLLLKHARKFNDIDILNKLEYILISKTTNEISNSTSNFPEVLFINDLYRMYNRINSLVNY